MNDKESTALALVPRGMAEAAEMAQRLSKSAMLPAHFKGREADVFWAIAFGLEVGLAPVAALRAVYVVHGRPGLYSDAMVGLCLSSGLCEYFRCVESSPTVAIYETKRRGDPAPRRKSFSMQDAIAAGLTSNETYKKFPTQMLEARCKSFLARDAYPDVLHGMHSVEELIDMKETAPGTFSVADFTAPSPPTTGRTIDLLAEPSGNGRPSPAPGPGPSPAAPDAPPSPPITSARMDANALANRLLACRTTDDLVPLVAELAAMPENSSKDELRRLYVSHRRLLQRKAEQVAAEPATEEQPFEVQA